MSWHCQNMTSLLLQEKEAYNFSCNGTDDLIVFHVIHWEGFTVENVTQPSQTNMTGSNATAINQTGNANVTSSNSTLNNQTIGYNNTVNVTTNATESEIDALNFTVPLPNVPIYYFSNPCHEKKTCLFNTSLLENPYAGKVAKRMVRLKASCQPRDSGFSEWAAWSTCPNSCGVLHYLTRRRRCLNPTEVNEGADCTGKQSQTKSQPCTKPCQGLNNTVCQNQSMDLICPPGSFINLDSIFFGSKSSAVCNSSSDFGPVIENCTTSEIETYNNVIAWERCEMQQNCSLVASIATFRDACPGFHKYLNIQYKCSPVVERAFCDEDNAKIKCPDEKRLILHDEIFYGRDSQSICPEIKNPRNCSKQVLKTNHYCNNYECNIDRVNADALKATNCPDVVKYIRFRYSCQTEDSIYTMWGPWGECEACGLHAKQVRKRKLINGVESIYWSWHGGNNLNDFKLCYKPCEEYNFTICDNSTKTISCPKYNNYPTVIEVRSVFYGRTSADVCASSGSYTNCSTLDTAKKEVMELCQGQNECMLRNLESILTDPCVGNSKFFNMSYRCQPVYEFARTEGYKMVPKNISCYEDMVIVPHDATWKSNECPHLPNTAYPKVKQDCDGNRHCYVNNGITYLGDPCVGSPKRFQMWYSCQTAKGGLSKEWGPWSNCTECGLYSFRERNKTCLHPATHTAGAHCPLVQETQNCNKPCPVQNLGFTNIENSAIAAVFGEPLVVNWKMASGTNVTIMFVWGDNSTNTTMEYVQANVTTPLLGQMTSHNYTSEGEYTLTLSGFNVVNNITQHTSVYVQVKLEGLNLTTPIWIKKNESVTLSMSLEKVSKALPYVTWSFGDKSSLITTNFTVDHLYTSPGNFTVAVNASNRVSFVETSKVILVQENITDFKFTSNIFSVSLNSNADLGLLWNTGSHLIICFNISDNSSGCQYSHIRDPSTGGVHLRHVFAQLGLFHVSAKAYNYVNTAHAATQVLVEIPISGFNASIVCHKKFKDCFQGDGVSVFGTITNGSNPHIKVDMNDSSVFIFSLSNQISLNYIYNTSGVFKASVTAFNNATQQTYEATLNMLSLTPLQGVRVICDAMVTLGNETTCHLSIDNGSAYECHILSDGLSLNYTYDTMPNRLIHRYNTYGIYLVAMTCSNALGDKTARYTTVVSGPTLGMSLSNNGPMVHGVVSSFRVNILNAPLGSCFMIDVGDGLRVAYGDKNCSVENYGISNVLPLKKAFTFNHTYSRHGIFKAILKGSGNLIKEEVTSNITITERPCNILTIGFINIAKTSVTSTRLQKSRDFTVRSSYTIKCDDANGAVLDWEVFQNNSNGVLKSMLKKSTSTSQLTIEARSLDYGIYRVSLRLTLEGVAGISDTTEGYINVVPTPLEVVIKQGSAFRRSQNDDITIDGSESRDPDKTGSMNKTLNFLWFCYLANEIAEVNITNRPVSSLIESVPAKNQSEEDSCARFVLSRSYVTMSSIQLSPQLIRQQIIMIELIVKEGNRHARTTSVMQLYNSSMPILYIRCVHNCQVRVDPTEILSISGLCSENCHSNVTKTWTLYNRNGSSNHWDLVSDFKSMVISSEDQYSLVFQKNVLKIGSMYTVRLTADNKDGGILGLSEYQFNTSVPPYGGDCRIEPNEGFAMKTQFTFRCHNWTVENEPALYRFGYREVYTDLRNILFSTSKIESALLLPAGHAKNNSLLDVFVVIEDFLGVSTTWEGSIKVLTRQLNTTELNSLVLQDNSQLNFYINIGDIRSASELVSGLLSIMNYEATLQYASGNSSSAAITERKTARSAIILKMSAVPTDNLEAVKQVSVTLASSAEVRNEVEVIALTTGTSKLDSMASVLLNKSKEDIGITAIADAAKDMVTAASNVMRSAAYVANYSRKGEEMSGNIKKSQAVVNNNMRIFDIIAKAVFNKHLPGQDDVIVQTTSTAVVYRRVTPKNIADKSVVVGGAEVRLPSSTVQHQRYNHTDIQMSVIPENPYTWDNSSLRMRSPIVSLKIMDDNSKPITVANLTEDIELTIGGVSSSPHEESPQFYRPADNSSLQYHTFTYSEPGESIRLAIRPVNKTNKFIVFVKLGSKPTELDFEISGTFPNYSSCNLTAVNEPYNCSSDPYSLFLAGDRLTLNGIYYVGIKYVTGDKGVNDEVKSREKRDCEQGRRSKRSCIKYKDPPPTLPGNGEYERFQKDYDRFLDINYTMGTESVGCRYWSLASNTWTTKGCKVGRRRSSGRQLSCTCNHLTSFGGSFFVAPNPIDLAQVWIAFQNPEDNIPIIVTMTTVMGVFLLVLIWARRADSKDEAHQNSIVMMQNNGVTKSYNYMVTIRTGQRRDAGTTANVFLALSGDVSESGVIPISTTTGAKFNRGSSIDTTVCLPMNLGSLLYIHIWHDNQGQSPAWFLDDVTIRNLQTGGQWNFVCDRWIAVENEECRTDVILYAASQAELNNYTRIFVKKTSNDLYDGHLWFSVVAKPPTSSFTRVQRCCCCLSLLFCTMVTSCMFYNIKGAADDSIIMIGPIKLSLREIVIGAQSGIIVFPMNFFIVFLFRKSMEAREKLDEPSKLTKKLRAGKFAFFYNECFESNGASRRMCRSGVFKGQVLYFLAWFLCIATSFASAVVTIMYSLMWKADISEKWCVSFFLSFIEDAFLIQPIKVALLAALLAFVIKETKKRKKNNYETLRNGDTDNFLDDTSEKGSEESAKVTNERRPPNRNFLENARRMRIKQIKTNQVVKDVLFYVVFLLLIMVYAYGHRDPIAFNLTKEIVDLSRPVVGLKHDQYWDWLSKQIIHMIFVGFWYNGAESEASLDGFITDRASFLVGLSRLRQLRVRQDTCAGWNPLLDTAGACYPSFSLNHEDKDFYKPGWEPLDPGTDRNNVSFEECPQHWRYQSARDLNGLPVWGVTNIYPGGGYVAELGYYPAKAYQVLDELYSNSWIDRHTRAVLLEFVVYNAQQNLFSAVTILVEFLPMGGMIPYSKIDTVRVYRYVNTYSTLLIASEIIIVLVIIGSLYLLIKRIYKQRTLFFKYFWNWVDIFQVLFGLASISMYFIKLASIQTTMKDLKLNPLVFVNFQVTVFLNDVDACLVAAVVFLTTIKFLRLLKYQAYIKLLDNVFARFSTDMSWFMVEFTMWLMPFVIFENIVFGTKLEDFHTILSSFQSSLNALLGSTYYNDLKDGDRVMGPLLFVGFNILVVFILLNIFISIINAFFQRPVDSAFTKATDPELMLFIGDKLRALFGINIVQPSGIPEASLENEIGSLASVQTIVEDVRASPIKDTNREYTTEGKTTERNPKLTVKEKMSRFHSLVSRILLLDEIEDTLYGMILLRRGRGSLRNRCHALIHVNPLDDSDDLEDDTQF
ncbi:uncharacterized protein LOC5513821 isoform X2 [Nematostella vectensis]|nr:uncharacterized protein LOC5513821 isoform X2 [Nematostella vectensis]